MSSNIGDFESFVALLFVRDNSVASEDLFIRRVQFFIKQRLTELASNKRSQNGCSGLFHYRSQAKWSSITDSGLQICIIFSDASYHIIRIRCCRQITLLDKSDTFPCKLRNFQNIPPFNCKTTGF